MTTSEEREMTIETATVGAGCFWGVEHVYRQVPGVIDVVSGFSGGFVPGASYREVCSGTTGHAEVVQLTFDRNVVSYEQILEVFWAMHDPTQIDRQGPDIGSQYRSAIFAHTPEQREIALGSKASAQGRFERPIATEISDFEGFIAAEAYHQRYYEMNGHEPYCHAIPPTLLADLGLELASG